MGTYALWRVVIKTTKIRINLEKLEGKRKKFRFFVHDWGAFFNYGFYGFWGGVLDSFSCMFWAWQASTMVTVSPSNV